MELFKSKDINDLNHELRNMTVGDKSLDVMERDHNLDALELPEPKIKIRYAFHHDGKAVKPESHWVH
ncbi:MAG: hypothetical protein HQM14_10665 [SAR324 cluster bacterium]|nr:hypothetical protein [SAR324 cluster bacterium]